MSINFEQILGLMNQMHTAGPNKNHMVTFKSTTPKQSLR